MVGFRLIDRSIGLLSTLILARFLAPNDFGLVAIATAVHALLELMGAFGFDSALIQRQSAERKHYDTAWTFNVIFGAAIAVLLVASASPVAAFYREPRLEAVLWVLALAALFGGFENIGTVAFRKELNFRREFYFLFAKRIVAVTVTVTLALMLRNYWALVAGVLTGKIVSVLISYGLHPYRPRLSLAASKDLFQFSKWIFISNVVQFLHVRSTDFILGRTAGTTALGIYSIAAEIAALPATEVVAPINRAVYPAYSKLASDLSQLRDRFLEVFSMIGIVVFPISVGLVCTAEPAVRLLLGDQWLDAIPIIQIIALSGFVGALQSNLFLAILALGKPKICTLLSAALLAVSLPFLVAASIAYGAIGAAYAYFGRAILGLFAIQIVFAKITKIQSVLLWRVLWRPAAASSFMAVIVLALDAWALGYPNVYLGLRLLALVAAGAASYVLAILVLWITAGRPAGAETRLLMLMHTTVAALRIT